MMRYSLGALLLIVTAIAAALGLREGNPALVGSLVLMILALSTGVGVVTFTLGKRAAADFLFIGILAVAFALLLVIL